MILKDVSPRGGKEDVGVMFRADKENMITMSPYTFDGRMSTGGGIVGTAPRLFGKVRF